MWWYVLALLFYSICFASFYVWIVSKFLCKFHLFIVIRCYIVCVCFSSVLLNYAVYLFGSFGFVCFELSIAVFFYLGCYWIFVFSDSVLLTVFYVWFDWIFHMGCVCFCVMCWDVYNNVFYDFLWVDFSLYKAFLDVYVIAFLLCDLPFCMFFIQKFFKICVFGWICFVSHFVFW